MLDPRAVAVQGIGYSHTYVATQGFLQEIGEAVQVALETLNLIASLVNPDILYGSRVQLNVSPMYLTLHEPFAGMVQIIRRGLKLNLDLIREMRLNLTLVDDK